VDFFKIDPSAERQILDFRPLGFHDVTLLGRYRYAKAHGRLEDHSHGGMLEICYLQRGQQTYMVAEDRYDLVGGDVFVTFPGETHGTGPAPEEKGVLYWMLVHVPPRTRPFLRLPPELGQHLLASLLAMPARHFPGGMHLGPTLKRIFAAYPRGDTLLGTVELQNLLLRFLLDVLAASQRSQRRVTPDIAAVQKFIADHIDRAWSVKELARVIGLSQSRLQSRFQEEVGISPAEYVLRKKVERARQMLDDPAHSVTEVAMRLGFSTSHYFTTVFKRYTGATPSAYRAQRGNRS
jgi:AraC-like DNA-binding protein